MAEARRVVHALLLSAVVVGASHPYPWQQMLLAQELDGAGCAGIEGAAAADAGDQLYMVRDGTALCVYNGTHVRPFLEGRNDTRERVTALAVNDPGSVVVTAGTDGKGAVVMEHRGYDGVWTSREIPVDRIVGEAVAEVHSLSLSDDGNYLAVAWGGNKAVLVNLLQNDAVGHPITAVTKALTPNMRAVVALSPDGRWFAAGAGLEVRVVDTQGIIDEWRPTPVPRGSSITAIAVAQGPVVAYGLEDGTAGCLTEEKGDHFLMDSISNGVEVKGPTALHLGKEDGRASSWLLTWAAHGAFEVYRIEDQSDLGGGMHITIPGATLGGFIPDPEAGLQPHPGGPGTSVGPGGFIPDPEAGLQPHPGGPGTSVGPGGVIPDPEAGLQPHPGGPGTSVGPGGFIPDPEAGLQPHPGGSKPDVGAGLLDPFARSGGGGQRRSAKALSSERLQRFDQKGVPVMGRADRRPKLSFIVTPSAGAQQVLRYSMTNAPVLSATPVPIVGPGFMITAKPARPVLSEAPTPPLAEAPRQSVGARSPTETGWPAWAFAAVAVGLVLTGCVCGAGFVLLVTARGERWMANRERATSYRHGLPAYCEAQAVGYSQEERREIKASHSNGNISSVSSSGGDRRHSTEPPAQPARKGSEALMYIPVRPSDVRPSPTSPLSRPPGGGRGRSDSRARLGYANTSSDLCLPLRRSEMAGSGMELGKLRAGKLEEV